MLDRTQESQLLSRVESETRRLEAELERTVVARLQAVRRMAHRWSSGGGTPYIVWRGDARYMLRQIDGLRQLQWIGLICTPTGPKARGAAVGAQPGARSHSTFALQLQNNAGTVWQWWPSHWNSRR